MPGDQDPLQVTRCYFSDYARGEGGAVWKSAWEVKQEGRGTIRERHHPHECTHTTQQASGWHLKTKLTPPGDNLREVERVLSFGAEDSHALNLVLQTMP